MPTIKRPLTDPDIPPRSKRVKSVSPKLESVASHGLAVDPFIDWPAPKSAILAAQSFILDIVSHSHSVLIAPDKDADGLTAGSILYKTLVLLGLPEERISVHHLSKGCNIHSKVERDRMMKHQPDCLVVLDQGSRPGSAILPGVDTLIIDHHMATEWPEQALVLTACHSPPIATTSLLTYLLLKTLHPEVAKSQDWRAVVGVFGDLGPSVAQWGTSPWPKDLGETVKKYGAKNMLDAVSAINAPRRTAEYNVPKAWEIMLNAIHPRDIAANAFLKLCKLDVSEETAKWARTAPKFSKDGRVAVIAIKSGFQIHPVIATRWAGTLGKKSKKLMMIMCANHGYNPDGRVSFSCRLSAPLRRLPEGERPNLIKLLNEIGDEIAGFHERVGGDYARGHKEATGGIIQAAEFSRLMCAMGVDTKLGGSTHASPSKPSSTVAIGSKSITDFFQKA